MGWCNGVAETRVLIASDKGDVSESGDCILIYLQHPKTGKPTSYLLNGHVLQEIHWFKKSYSSWFLGDYACEDGGLYAATPVDPSFLLLPLFDEARMKKGDDLGKFRQLDEIIYVDGYPAYSHLSSIAERCMKPLCDTKEVGSMKFFRLDDSKVLAWLHCKIRRLMETLPTLGVNYAAQNEINRIADAVAIVNEYVKEDSFLAQLCQQMGWVFPASNEKPDFVEISQSDTPNNQENGQSKRKTSANKKAKIETQSRNIKDMFSMALRKR